MTTSNTKSLKIFFHAMDGAGPQNASVGMAQALLSRGHRISFLLNAAFAGQFSKYGFDEILLKRSAPPPTDPSNNNKPMNPIKIYAQNILKMGIVGPLTPLEKLKANKVVANEMFLQVLFNTAVDFNAQIEEAIRERKADLLILDHFLCPPAYPASGLPWFLINSGNPLCLLNLEQLPPHTSGYPVDSDPKLWAEFRELQHPILQIFTDYQKRLYDAFNYRYSDADLPRKYSSFPQSRFGYIYGYPEELDYSDVIDIDSNYIHVDAFCRDSVEPFELPVELAVKPGEKLIYFSLGSMGSVDVQLVKRVCAILSKSGHKSIVSKGPIADEYELPENCWGQGFLPQTSIIPLVDLVITHGGNNTVTEAFAFGKPMIVMPLFGDQLDNAQRLHEKGYGIRLEPYTFQDDELIGAIERLINDQKLRERLQIAAKRIASSNSKQKACEKIEKFMQKF